MEISHFLHNQKTMDLREKFMESVFLKHGIIQSYMNDLRLDLSFDQKIELVSSLFGEVHRLKGSGGTYGFYEISRVYFNALIYIRSPQNEMRMLTKEELDSAAIILDSFTKYYPALKKAFMDLNNEVYHIDDKSIFYVAKDRGDFYKELEQLVLSNNVVLFSVMTIEDAVFALDKVSPGMVFIDASHYEDEFLSLIKQFKDKESVSDIVVITEDLDKHEDYINHGATKVVSATEIDRVQLLGFLK